MATLAEQHETQKPVVRAAIEHIERLADTRVAATNGSAWLEKVRAAGLDRFKAVGFPSNKEESWRFTNIQPITRTEFQLATADLTANLVEAIKPFSIRDAAACELVFLNGTFAPGLSKLGALPRGVRALSLADAVKSDAQLVERSLGKLALIESNPFVALNTGFIHDGAFVHIARGAAIEAPIHLLFLSTPGAKAAAAHTRVLLVAEENSDSRVVETYAGHGAGVYFTNAVTEVVAGDNAHIDHYKIQQETLEAYHVSTTQVKLGRSATFTSHAATMGGLLTRNDVNAEMAGEGAYATLNGLVLISGKQHVDNHTLLDHAQPNCPSHELYKHVLDGQSTCVFKGQILVRQIAQKTDSKQSSKSLLLSDEATMNSQPALEIYADDVKCTHGSTTGPVDQDMMFYLRTRGIGEEAARHVLTYAFAADVTRRIKVTPVRERIEDYLAAQHNLPQDLRITDVGMHNEAAR